VKVLASAPGRAGILGNPTDGYGGAVMSCSLAERATVTLTSAETLRARVHLGPGASGRALSGELRHREDLQLRGDELDVVRAVVRFLGRDGFAADIDIRTEVPLRAGLAGSTAVLASLLAGALLLDGRDPQPDHPQYRYLLAEMVRTVELHFLEVQCGYQDQYMTVFGGLNYMDFRGKELYRTLEREPFATIEPLGQLLSSLPLVVISTGQERVSGAVLKPVRDRWLEGDPVVRRGYREIAELASHGKRALLAQDWRAFAQLMNQNHSIQQQVGASGELIDEAVDRARQAGAWGAKLAGAGGGGSIILLHPDFLGQPGEALATHPIARALLARYPQARLISPKPAPGVTCQALG
jgi:galactokinase/mevalonate kinase-like predicted kinase